LRGDFAPERGVGGEVEASVEQDTKFASIGIWGNCQRNVGVAQRKTRILLVFFRVCGRRKKNGCAFLGIDNHVASEGPFFNDVSGLLESTRDFGRSGTSTKGSDIVGEEDRCASGEGIE
jgi:hypothetical protein